MLTYAVAFVGLALLAILYRHERRRLRSQRARFFDECLHLFQSYRVVQEGPTYPLLSGRYRGHDIRLEPAIDDMAWRRVPVLWLKVTLLRQNACPGVLDFIVRPGAVEIHSPSSELDYHIPLPQGWPAQGLLCADNPSAADVLDRLTPHMGMFADPHMKELTITPRGVRLMCMIWQASRLHYGVFREVRFESTHLDPDLAESLLESAIGIAEAMPEVRSVERAA
jgi:hypothetical protein